MRPFGSNGNAPWIRQESSVLRRESPTEPEGSLWQSGSRSDDELAELREPSPPEDSVRLYFNQMGVVPLLGREGELRLAKQIASGDRQVRKLLSRTCWLWRRVGELEQELETNHPLWSSCSILRRGEESVGEGTRRATVEAETLSGTRGQIEVGALEALPQPDRLRRLSNHLFRNEGIAQ